MERGALYGGDYYAWLQQQVAMLRDLAREGRNFPEGLDLEQVAEEVEDIGKAELRATRGFLRSIFVHVLLVAFDLDTSKRRRWSLEVRIFHAGLRQFATSSMEQAIDMDELWSHAIELADAQLHEYVNRLPRSLPVGSPLSFEEIISKDVDWDSIILGLEKTATGQPRPRQRNASGQP